MPVRKKRKSVPFVSIAGNIAVGKTTLTRMIGERLGWRQFYESVDDNPYLSDFYGDMGRWSFHLQVYFLSKRFEVQREMAEGDRPSVQDRTIYEDAEIFARSLYELGKMSDRDWENYCSLFRSMTSYLTKPSLIIFLRASTDTLLTRLARRGREFEHSIAPDYLHRLNLAYERWMGEAKKDHSILVFDTDGFDVFHDRERLDGLILSAQQAVSDAQ